MFPSNKSIPLFTSLSASLSHFLPFIPGLVLLVIYRHRDVYNTSDDYMNESPLNFTLNPSLYLHVDLISVMSCFPPYPSLESIADHFLYTLPKTFNLLSNLPFGYNLHLTIVLSFACTKKLTVI